MIARLLDVQAVIMAGNANFVARAIGRAFLVDRSV
jgi:hypothetical protein